MHHYKIYLKLKDKKQTSVQLKLHLEFYLNIAEMKLETFNILLCPQRATLGDVIGVAQVFFDNQNVIVGISKSQNNQYMKGNIRKILTRICFHIKLLNFAIYIVRKYCWN